MCWEILGYLPLHFLCAQKEKEKKEKETQLSNRNAQMDTLIFGGRARLDTNAHMQRGHENCNSSLTTQCREKYKKTAKRKAKEQQEFPSVPLRVVVATSGAMNLLTV